MAATKEHLENLIKEGGTSDEDKADFEAAFSDEDTGSATSAVKQTVANIDQPAGDDSTKASSTEQPAAGDKSAAADTSQAGKQEPDRIAAMEERMNKWMRDVGGVVGNVKDQLNRMSNAARTTATAAGAASPTKEQVEAAANDAQAWNELKEKYPEWGDAIEQQMNVVEQRVLGKVPKVDVDAIRNDILKSANESSQLTAQQIEERLPLYIKHPTWKKDINSQEFMDFALTGGPTKEEYAEYKQLETSNAAKAAELVNEFIRKHPQWWSDKGSKFFEGSIDDSISLLDSFQAAKAAANQVPADKSRQAAANKARLEQAVTPTTGATRVKQTKSDNQEFEEAFSS